MTTSERITTESHCFPFIDQYGNYREEDECLTVISGGLEDVIQEGNTVKIYVKKPFIQLKFKKMEHETMLSSFSNTIFDNVSRKNHQKFVGQSGIVEVIAE